MEVCMRMLGVAALVLGICSFGIGAYDAYATAPDCSGVWTAANGGNPGATPPVPPPWVMGCSTPLCQYPGYSATCSTLPVGTDGSGNIVVECVCYSNPHDWWYSTNDRCVTQKTGGNVSCRNANCPAPNVCNITVTVNDTNGDGKWNPTESASMKCDCYTPGGSILADPNE